MDLALISKKKITSANCLEKFEKQSKCFICLQMKTQDSSDTNSQRLFSKDTKNTSNSEIVLTICLTNT